MRGFGQYRVALNLLLALPIHLLLSSCKYFRAKCRRVRRIEQEGQSAGSLKDRQSLLK